jgi:glutamine synthetase type III
MAHSCFSVVSITTAKRCSRKKPPAVRDAMDFQTFINVGAGTALTVMGWFARELWGAVKELRTDLSKLREELAREYITKFDFRDAMKELREALDRIESKLDRKADKS